MNPLPSAPDFAVLVGQQPPPPPTTISNSSPSAWDLYCQQTEVRDDIRVDLHNVLSTSKIVLLLDDSGSMNTQIVNPATASSGMRNVTGIQTTRWSELMNDVTQVVQLVTAVNPNGIDIAFLNREGRDGVRDPSQISDMFIRPPSGGTPLIGAIRSMYYKYGNVNGDVLLIVITDGEPSDGDYDALFNVLSGKKSNWYISLTECNDNEEEMDYLTGWDYRISNFHNQEDYGEELRLVRSVQGANAKFTRANYIQMIVLSPKYRKYAIDMRNAGGKGNPFGSGMNGGGYMSGFFCQYSQGNQSNQNTPPVGYGGVDSKTTNFGRNVRNNRNGGTNGTSCCSIL